MKATLATEKRISVKPNKVEGILNFDVDNKYPQRVMDIINSSSTGSLCHELSSMFAFGNGFQDANFHKLKVNSDGLTAGKLGRKVVNDLRYFNGCAVHVNYNAAFKAVSFNFIPFEHCRLTTNESKHPDKVAIYSDWEKINGRIEKEKVDYIDFFDPSPEVIEAQVIEAGGWDNYKGQVFYYSKNGKSYPLSPSDSVLEDMQTDAEVKTFKYRNVSTNFMASHIIEVDAFEEEEDRQDFENVLTDFQGSDNAMKILMLEKTAGQEASFNLQKVDIQGVDKLYEYTENSVVNAIIRKYLIPPVLLLQTAGKIGSSTEILDATNYYNGIISSIQDVVSEIFAELFKNTTLTVNQDFNIKQIKAKPDSSEVVALISNTNLTADQITEALVILYGFDLSEALKLSGQ